MTIHRNHRMVRRLSCCGGTLTGLLLGWTGTGALYAQTPPTTQPTQNVSATPDAAQSQRLFWKKTDIQLPIQINEKYRAMIREVQLYIKEQPTAPWTLRDKVSPDQKVFTFHAEHDGEIAFTMVTVDKQGRSIPKNVQQEPPALVVVFDTKTPELAWKNLGTTPEGQLIHFEVIDDNVDNARVRLFFQGGDKQFRPLEMLPGRSNVYCVPAQAVFTGMVRASAEDLAGNRCSSEMHVSQLPKETESVATQPVPTAPTAQVNHQDPVVTQPNSAPNLLPEEVKVVVPLLANDLPPVQKTPIVQEANPSTHTTFRRPDGSEGPRYEASEVRPVVNKVETPAPSILPLPLTTMPTPTVSRKEQPKRHFVNQSKIYLDYAVENLNSASVGKVEVWATRDQGKNWYKHCEEAQGKSPVEIQFAEDGLYGITLVVTSKQGPGGTAPVAGDLPDWMIEVDTAKPSAQITHIETMHENGVPSVQIVWTATDKNLGESPVELAYAATPKGPWLVIAKGLKREGEHRWTPPAGIGMQAYLRMTVQDQAGNVAISGTMEAVHFSAERPRAVIRSIRTEAVSVSASSPEKN